MMTKRYISLSASFIASHAKRQIALKNYNLLPRLKNINYICNNKPKFHNNVTRLARQT